MNHLADIPVQSFRLFAFPSDLGWMAILHGSGLIQRNTMGHDSEVAAIRSILENSGDFDDARVVNLNAGERRIARRFQSFAAGSKVSFEDLKLDLSRVTSFQKKVLNLCRCVPYGRTLTYGQLAARAGSPRGARAVGNTMKKNPFPIVVPCHRIVAGSGIGGFSAPSGSKLKLQLLELEGIFQYAG